MTEYAHAAQHYAEQGRKVLPLEPGGKRPLFALSWEDASGDPVLLASWWEREPNANVGIACTDGLVVLDVDGEQGEATLMELVEEHDGFGPTLTAFTGRGRHLYFRNDAPLAGWRYGGLELKAHGYVVAPPSVHTSGRRYHYPERELEPGPLPQWLVPSPKPVPAPTPRSFTVASPHVSPERLAAAGRAAVEGELGKLYAHPREPGSGRHTALFAAACALGAHVAAGSLDELAVRHLLEGAVPQLGLALDGEALHQIENGLERGAGEPYQLRERERPPSNGNGNGAGYVHQEPAPGAQEQSKLLRIRPLTELGMRDVEWLWDERVPLGKLTILAGLPGQGKSLLTCWMASQASRGLLAGALLGTPTPVLLVSAEDDPEDTIMPRVYRTDGDPYAVHVVDVRETSSTGDYTRQVSLPNDVPGILEAMEHTGARLVVLDPIGGLLDADVDAHKAQHVRRALGPLKQAAEERHAAVVLVHHLKTKDQSTDPLQRLADSHAFVGLPRSVLAFGPDPEEEQAGDRGSSKVLYVAKSNLAGQGEHGLRFGILDGKLVSDGRGGKGFAPSIELVGAVESSAADSLSSSDERSALREAMDFLREFLEDGPRPSAEVKAQAMALDITAITLKRARAKVCGRARKRGEDGAWVVGLRTDHEPHAPHDPLGDGAGKPSGSSGSTGSQEQGVVLEFRLDSDPDSDGSPDEPGPPGVTPTDA